jgi:hypothetical protein
LSPLEYLGQLFDPAPGPPSLWYLVLVALFLFFFVASLVLLVFRRSLFPGHSLHLRLARRFGRYGVTLGATGLVLLAARYLGVYLIQTPFLLVLAVAGVAALGVYSFWYFRNRYPQQLAAQEAAKVREKFIRPGAHSPRRRQAKKARR